MHFKFLPGLGFYGFGLIHMIGGLSRAATIALRQLIDAGTLKNLPAGFKSRGLELEMMTNPYSLESLETLMLLAEISEISFFNCLLQNQAQHYSNF